MSSKQKTKNDFQMNPTQNNKNHVVFKAFDHSTRMNNDPKGYLYAVIVTAYEFVTAIYYFNISYGFRCAFFM